MYSGRPPHTECRTTRRTRVPTTQRTGATTNGDPGPSHTTTQRVHHTITSEPCPLPRSLASQKHPSTPGTGSPPSSSSHGVRITPSSGTVPVSTSDTVAVGSGALTALDVPPSHAPAAHATPIATTTAATTRLLTSITPFRGFIRGIRQSSNALPTYPIVHHCTVRCTVLYASPLHSPIQPVGGYKSRPGTPVAPSAAGSGLPLPEGYPGSRVYTVSRARVRRAYAALSCRIWTVSALDVQCFAVFLASALPHHHAHHVTLIDAQCPLIAVLERNPQVVGSNPTGGTKDVAITGFHPAAGATGTVQSAVSPRLRLALRCELLEGISHVGSHLGALDVVAHGDAGIVAEHA